MEKEIEIKNERWGVERRKRERQKEKRERNPNHTASIDISTSAVCQT